MKRKFLLLTVLLCSLSLFSATPRVAVVLSGGGARGFAHIAVLEALEKQGIPIDMVFGTSMGALIGGLYCAGYTPAEIRTEIGKIDMLTLFNETSFASNYAVSEAFYEVPENVFSLGFDSNGIGDAPGLVGDQKILALLNSLLSRIPKSTNFDDLAVPFRCVSTDAFSGRRIVHRDGSLVSAIRSSISLPIIFTPYPQEDGKFAMDGGLVDNMPVQLAKSYGFDIVIACDVNAKQRSNGDELDSLSAVLNQTIVLVTQASVTAQYPLADILFIPELGDVGTLDFSKAAEIIRRGEEACAEQEYETNALAQRIEQSRPLVFPSADRAGNYSKLPDLRISRVQIVNTSSYSTLSLPKNEVFDSFLGLYLDEATKYKLSLTLDRIKRNYALASISYDIQEENDGSAVLLINARSFEESSSKISLGVNGTLGFASNTPNAAGWILPEVHLNAIFSRVFLSDFTFDTTLSVGQTLRLDFATKYPFVADTSSSLDLVVNAAIFRGSLTPEDSKINGERQADLDQGFSFDLGFDYHFKDFGRSDFGSLFNFLYLNYPIGDDPNLLVIPSLYWSLVWNTQKGIFAPDGLKVEIAATVGNSETLVYSLRGAICERYPIQGTDSIRWDLQFAYMRLPYQLITSYVEFGGLCGMPGYSVGTLKRDMILGGFTWQHELSDLLGFPSHAMVVCRFGTADGYNPYTAGSQPDSSFFSDCMGLEAGLGLMLGTETPIGNVVAGIGASMQGNLSLIIGIM
jgi:NTE family protein